MIPLSSRLLTTSGLTLSPFESFWWVYSMCLKSISTFLTSIFFSIFSLSFLIFLYHLFTNTTVSTTIKIIMDMQESCRILGVGVVGGVGRGVYIIQ